MIEDPLNQYMYIANLHNSYTHIIYSTDCLNFIHTRQRFNESCHVKIFKTDKKKNRNN